MTLHPCTCGSAPRLVIDAGGQGWYVHCPNCQAKVIGPDEATVIRRWDEGTIILYERIQTAQVFAESPITECCRETRNLQLLSPQRDLTIWRCRVCGRKHRRLEVDSGAMGVKR